MPYIALRTGATALLLAVLPLHVSAQDAAPPPAAVAPAQPPAGFVGARARSATAVRSGPDRAAPTTFSLRAGEPVWASEPPARGFRRIRTIDGRSGFVAEGALDLSPEAAQAAAEAPATVERAPAPPPALAPAGAAPGRSAPAAPTVAPAATASPAPERRGYVAIRGGVLAPQHFDLENLDLGPAFEVAAGWHVARPVALELSAGRWATSGSQTEGSGSTAVTVEVGLRVIPVQATLRVLAPFERVHLSALAGFGVYSIAAEAKQSEGGVQIDVTSDEATALGFHLGAGVAVDAGGALLGAELRYVTASARLFGDSIGLDSLVATATLGFPF